MELHPDPPGPPPAADKDRLRAALMARRRDRPAVERDAARAAVTAHLAALPLTGSTVCGYLPLPSEPLDRGLLRRLHEAGVDVLLPVSTADSPLDWCRWTEGLTPRGTFGIEEPTGPRLGSGAIAGADLVLIPALAVDRAGNRLGRGGGHYDRSLALFARSGLGPGRVPARRLLAVVYDDELLHAVPHGPLDHRVTHVVTPSGGITPVG